MKGQVSWFERMAFLAAHPKGAILWTDDAQNPGDRYGGTWALKTAGRFLIPACAPDAGDQTFAVGSMGGTSAETLTIKQIPSHTHSVLAYNSGAADGTSARVFSTGTTEAATKYRELTGTNASTGG